jgi:hypothetical protein
MTKEASGKVDNPADNSTDQNGNPSGEAKSEVVSRETYLKVLNEKKRRDQELAQFKEKAEKLEMEKMQLEGNKDQLISELQKKLQAEAESRKKEKETFVWSTVNNQIIRKAEKLGCVDSKTLLKLLDKDDFSNLTVMDNYEIEEAALDNVLNTVKERYSNLNLFNTKKVNVNNPTANYSSGPQPKTLKQLSDSELEAEIKRLDELEKRNR